MSLLSTDYNSGSSGDNNSGGSSDNDYEERERLSLDKYAMASFKVSGISYHEAEYGLNVYLDIDDVEVMHGMLYDRTWDGGDLIDDYDDDVMKVFGFGNWFDTNPDGTLDEELQEKFVNHRISENIGSNTFPYEFEELVTEGDDEIEMGNMSMKLTNSTKSRTILKVLTDAGHGVIDDKDSSHNWVRTNQLNLRDDILGRRIVVFYKDATFTPDGEDDEITYTDAVVLDAKTGAGITIQNGDSDSSSDSSDGGSSGTVGGSDDDDSLPEGVPEEANDIIDFMARTEETDRDQIENLVSNEADDYDLDAVAEEVERRMD